MSTPNSNDPNGFSPFGLHKNLMRGVRAAGYENPRPIQAESIPAILEGRDVLGLAQTGTGKTAAFALPVIQHIMNQTTRESRVLVLAPTRELANQIAEEFQTFSKFTDVTGMTIYGGISMGNQISSLRRRPDVIVGCPGRVLDLMQQGHLKLNSLDTLILDEADHMFDMGFLPDIKKILSRLPKNRQNLLFSATMPKDIRHLATDLLSDPHVVELADKAPVSTIDHALYRIPEKRKRDLLHVILDRDDFDSAIIFTRTKHRAKRLADQLSKAGHRSAALQGNMSQSQRDRAMRGFRERTFDILVATDIAARGLDVEKVSHVINFDVPNTPEAYTHRIGRTGRSEREGIAFTFVTGEDIGWVKATERMIGSKIERRREEGFEPDQEARSSSRSKNGNGRSNRSRSGSSRSNGSRSNGSRSKPKNSSSRKSRGQTSSRSRR
jgi:ATP-dependent RNA helicase RhlE